MTLEYTGGCLCGAVRYRFTAAPITTRVCWCRDCQYLGAGSGTVNSGFPTSALTVEGPLTDYVRQAASGNTMHRRFCSACGTPMFSAAESRPQWVFVRVGTLDDPGAVTPVLTIWAASAPSWASIDDNLQCIAGQPPPAG
jgi:hypothetical protein